MIAVYDDVLADPVGYRADVLTLPFQSIPIGPVTFHGIAAAPRTDFGEWFARTYPAYEPTVTFVRQSPAGQVEPNDVHTDADMGDLTALLYLNPEPPATDGTIFWQHLASRAMSGDQWLSDGHDRRAWAITDKVPARFNRCVVFSAPLFHSRALAGNYGEGDNARLIQVLFAKART